MGPPKHIAIVGCGHGWWYAKESNAEQFWCVNDGVTLLKTADICFNMHHLDELGNLSDEKLKKRMLDSLALCTERNIPIVATKAVPEYPTSVAYPIDEVTRHFGVSYFTCTSSYMVAYAVYLRIPRIDVFGITCREAYDSQRPCVEFWLGVGIGRGLDMRIFGDGTSLLKTEDSLTSPTTKQWRYGYDDGPSAAFLGGIFK